MSARSIARKLGSSTMPIYSHFRSLDSIEEQIRVRARELQKQYQKRKYTGHTLLDLAVGYIVFARDEKNLFRFLYLERPEYIRPEDMPRMRESFLSEFGEHSEEVTSLGELHADSQQELMQYTWVFTHGLATLVNSGALSACSDEMLKQMLMDAGAAFYLWTTSKGEDNVDTNE